ncbi:MAG: acylphosphatase [Spirochaetaceae bacterium]|nr:MAG: acylphosphatase [Spirochaetaceae bacterium]
MDEKPVKAFTATVTGRVQGVGFRFSTQRKAKELGLSGFVQNRMDGAVRVVAEGNPEALSLLATWLSKGPPGAFVRNVHIENHQPHGSYNGFTVEF